MSGQQLPSPDLTGQNAAYPLHSHVPALDGIRGAAILWVILHNTTTLPMDRVEGVLYVLKLFTNPGWIGVQLFFALSGFLITGKLLDSRHAQNYYSGFYAKRFLRIFPLYYGVLIAFLLIPALLNATPDLLHVTAHNQWWLWLFVSNFAPVSLYGFGHFWSLAVEEQFYLIWPVLVHRLSPQRVLLLCCLIVAAAFFIRILMILSGYDPGQIYDSTFCRMDALAAGGAGAALLRTEEGPKWINRHATAAMASAAALFAFGVVTTTGFHYESLTCEIYGYSILAFCCAALTVYAAVPAPNRMIGHLTAGLSSRWLRSLGKYSYGMYVIHGLLFNLIGDPWMRQHFGPRLPSAAVFAYSMAVLIATYLLAWVSYHTYEKHFLRLKRSFEPRMQNFMPAGAALRTNSPTESG